RPRYRHRRAGAAHLARPGKPSTGERRAGRCRAGRPARLTELSAHSPVGRLVSFSLRRAWTIAGVGLALTAAAMTWVATHFAMTTDTDKLISRSMPYVRRAEAFDRLFNPDPDRIVVVIDGRTPELAYAAATALTAKLSARAD